MNATIAPAGIGTEASSTQLLYLVDRFEQAWQDGLRPALDDFLPARGAHRQAALIELAHVDLEYRLKSGESVCAQNYLEDFPDLANNSKALRALRAAEQELRQRQQSPDSSLSLPKLGQRLGDFELVRLLGEGSFARVFLARQLSLGRLVALKVSPTRSREARILAQLEHDHIVRVFSETVDPQHGQRLLCMQYVSGTNLADVIAFLKPCPGRAAGGRAILAAIDARSSQAEAFDPAGLRDRESLAGCDLVEAVCWIGARLAEALAHGHGQGILHPAINPPHILINRSAR